MKKLTTVAASATIVATFTASTVGETENPFGMQELSTGYNVAMSTMEGACGADKAKEVKCGEGKCGEGKAADTK